MTVLAESHWIFFVGNYRVRSGTSGIFDYNFINFYIGHNLIRKEWETSIAILADLR